MRKELVALETQEQAILGNHAGRSMNRLPIYEMASSQCEYCFHPVFSRAFGMVRPDNEKRVVYPANVDMLTIT